MKKYIIRNEDGSKQTVMPAIHNTRKEALLTILHYATEVVKRDKDDSRIEIPVDYMVEEVEDIGVNEAIPDFESAKEFIGRPESFSILTVRPFHAEALVALNKLFTIAQAWNKSDGFVPDFSNRMQTKYFPWFKYDKDTKRFVFAYSTHAPSNECAFFGFRLCFKTEERARQFGSQFLDLYNQVFLS